MDAESAASAAGPGLPIDASSQTGAGRFRRRARRDRCGAEAGRRTDQGGPAVRKTSKPDVVPPFQPHDPPSRLAMSLILSLRSAGPSLPLASPRGLAATARLLLLACGGLLVMPGFVRGQDLPIEPARLDRAEPVDFAKEIVPILKRNCLACHHRNEAEGGLNLETYAALIEGGDGGAGIVPHEVDESYVFVRATGREEPLMPPEGNGVGAEPLTPEELALLQLWIL